MCACLLLLMFDNVLTHILLYNAMYVYIYIHIFILFNITVMLIAIEQPTNSTKITIVIYMLSMLLFVKCKHYIQDCLLYTVL